MQQYVVGNWKMNGSRVETAGLASSLVRKLSEAERPLPRIIVCPPFPYLGLVHDLLHNTTLKIAAQSCSQHLEGAFTGEVSARQVSDMGVSYVILGHSERRTHYGETNSIVQSKVSAALKGKLQPIICIGETAGERESGRAVASIITQLQESLPRNIKAEQFIVAYEPVWAIGTGITPRIEEIQHIQGVIRQELSKLVSPGGIVPILYGGSVTALNAREILQTPNVNGVLVGNASLKLEDFWQIIQSSEE